MKLVSKINNMNELNIVANYTDYIMLPYELINIENVNKDAKICVSYGESAEEALDTKWSVIREHISGSESYKLRQRAFRYIYIEGDLDAEVYAELEYLPLNEL